MAAVEIRYRLVDVFADSPFKGNQLAVFLDTGKLDAGDMQKIAREMNLSETAFVSDVGGDRDSPGCIRTRIFTVGEELPFAGHPTLGTAFVLRSILQRDEISLLLGVGKVTVKFTEGESGLYGEMVQPEPVFGKVHRRSDLADIFRVPEEEFDPELPIESVSTGNEFIIVPFRKLDTLINIEPDFPKMEEYARRTGAHFFYMVTRETQDTGAILHARMKFYGGEDPATGSAAGPATAWLLKHGVLKQGEQAFIEQGIEMQRPSRIFVGGDMKDGKPTRIRVGGYCFSVGSGTIMI